MNEYEAQALRRLREKVERSDVFLGIVTQNYLEDPQMLLQVGMAVLMDKPLYIAVAAEVRLPKTLEKIAKRVERYSALEDIELCVGRILAHIDEEG